MTHHVIAAPILLYGGVAVGALREQGDGQQHSKCSSQLTHIFSIGNDVVGSFRVVTTFHKPLTDTVTVWTRQSQQVSQV